jgi:hypothetical protein
VIPFCPPKSKIFQNSLLFYITFELIFQCLQLRCKAQENGNENFAFTGVVSINGAWPRWVKLKLFM